MLIEPTSTIKIYKNVRLDNTYENTLYFNNITEQNTFFHSTLADPSYLGGQLKYTFAFQSYQRVNKGRLRIERKADDLYDCNYMAFMNATYGQKWFYAFITSVNYINDVTTEITYEIDVMQTYAFDYTLTASWVEREHSSSDNIGDNLLGENVETGELLTDYQRIYTDDYSTQSIGALLNKISDTQSPLAKTWANLSNAIGLVKVCDVGQDQTFNNWLANYRATPEWVTKIFQYPSRFNNESGAIASERYSHSITIPRPTDLNGYIPRNKKLFTYPYTCLVATNLSGEEQVYKWEYFDSSLVGNNAKFNVLGCIYPEPYIFSFPQGYDGKITDYTRGISLKDFPEVVWTTDEFNTWLFRNSVTASVSVIGEAQNRANAEATTSITDYSRGNKRFQDIDTTGMNIMTSTGKFVYGENYSGAKNWGNLSSVVQSAFNNSSYKDKIFGGNSVLGTLSGNTMLTSFNNKCFKYYVQSLRPQFARIIDEYFDKYGYKTMRYKVPNRNVRKHWTYTQTIGCNLFGGCSTTAIEKIKSIYNNGITFWKNATEIGAYSNTLASDNTPL